AGLWLVGTGHGEVMLAAALPLSLLGALCFRRLPSGGATDDREHVLDVAVGAGGGDPARERGEDAAVGSELPARKVVAAVDADAEELAAPAEGVERARVASRPRAEPRGGKRGGAHAASVRPGPVRRRRPAGGFGIVLGDYAVRPCASSPRSSPCWPSPAAAAPGRSRTAPRCTRRATGRSASTAPPPPPTTGWTASGGRCTAAASRSRSSARSGGRRRPPRRRSRSS